VAFGLVQTKKGYGSGVSSLVVTFTNNVVANNRVLVDIGLGNNVGSTLNAVSDGASNSYTNADLNAAGGINNLYVRSANITSGGGTALAITVSMTGGPDDLPVCLSEYSGLSTATNAVDTSGSNSSASAATAHTATTSGNSTAVNQLVHVFNHDDGNGGSQTGASGTTVQASDTTDVYTFSIGDKSSTSGATQTGNITTGVSLPYTMGVVVYKLGAATTPSSLTPQNRPGPRFRPWMEPQLPLPTGITQILASDTATGSDGVTSVGLSGPGDAGAGTDSVTQIVLGSSGEIADTSTGADAVSLVGLSATETATGADAVSLVVLGSANEIADTASGADGGLATDLGPTTLLDRHQTGPRFRPWMRPQQPIGQVVAGPVQVSAADTASGTEAVVQIGLGQAGEISDVGAGADVASQIVLNSADAGSASDAGSIGLSGADSAAGQDAVSLVVLGPAGEIADSATGADGQSIVVLSTSPSPLLLQPWKGPRFMRGVQGQESLGGGIPAPALPPGPRERHSGPREPSGDAGGRRPAPLATSTRAKTQAVSRRNVA
jgi:hypothetical protein